MGEQVNPETVAEAVAAMTWNAAIEEAASYLDEVAKSQMVDATSRIDAAAHARIIRQKKMMLPDPPQEGG